MVKFLRKISLLLSLHHLTLLLYFITLSQSAPGENETVSINARSVIKYFNLPTSDRPVMSWMDIQRGIYPNTSLLLTNPWLNVGEPITIFIYLKDSSRLYDVMVTDCWALEDENVEKSRNKLHLTTHNSSTGSKLINTWHRHALPQSPGDLTVFLHTDMMAFKFPDKNQIYITCNIELCFKLCQKKNY